MATSNGRTTEQVRRDIEAERERLAVAVDDLRAGIDDATDINAKLKSKLPVATAAALGTGFVLAGGIRATLKVLLRYRESRQKSGPFSFLSRD
jgi:hypothetical protein